jgi:hypothetical protein
MAWKGLMMSSQHRVYRALNGYMIVGDELERMWKG